MFYFSCVKRLLATFFSLALILSQAAFMPGLGGLAAHKTGLSACCGHCGHCNAQCCRADKSDSHSSAPAVPAHGLSQNEWQFLTAASVQLLPQAETHSLAFSSLRFFQPSVAAPLYQRNCSYLI
jgi:hypothetical protein